MKNIFLSVVVVTTLIAAGLGGTFAGFVDTEISEGNFYQAGISDLLVNGKNDPIGAKLQYTHGAPCKSIDFWIDLYNWGECQGGMVYMQFKDLVSEENGTKLHLGVEYVYDGVAPGDPPIGVPEGYRPAVGDEPKGPAGFPIRLDIDSREVSRVSSDWWWYYYCGSSSQIGRASARYYHYGYFYAWWRGCRSHYSYAAEIS